MLRICAAGKSAGILKRALNRRRHRERRHLGAHHPTQRHEAVVQRHVGIAHLRQRNERLRLRIAVQPAIARVAHDADDLARRLREIGAHAGADDQPVPDGIVVFFQYFLARAWLITTTGGAGGVVPFGESAAAHDGNLEDIEEARRHVVPAGAAVRRFRSSGVGLQ